MQPTDITTDTLVSQFDSLKRQMRKPVASTALITLKMGRVVATAAEVLTLDERRAFRARAGLQGHNLYNSYTAIGRAFSWLKPVHKHLPPAYTVLRRIAQRLDADSVVKAIDAGIVSPFMQVADANKLPPKYPGKGSPAPKAKPRRFTITLTLPVEGFNVVAAHKFVSRLASMLTANTKLTVSKDLEAVFDVNALNVA